MQNNTVRKPAGCPKSCSKSRPGCSKTGPGCSTTAWLPKKLFNNRLAAQRAVQEPPGCSKSCSKSGPGCSKTGPGCSKTAWLPKLLFKNRMAAQRAVQKPPGCSKSCSNTARAVQKPAQAVQKLPGCTNNCSKNAWLPTKLFKNRLAVQKVSKHHTRLVKKNTQAVQTHVHVLKLSKTRAAVQTALQKTTSCSKTLKTV